MRVGTTRFLRGPPVERKWMRRMIGCNGGTVTTGTVHLLTKGVSLPTGTSNSLILLELTEQNEVPNRSHLFDTPC